MSNETSIIGARASVMVYDDLQKKWVPSGTSSGLSKVQIYHHQENNTFRVVGRKLQDHEVVINCSILKGLKYNQATATFHQWRDSKFVYGLNFSSQQDAEAFARAMMHTLEVLSGRARQQSAPPLPNGTLGYDEDMGYRTMTREDAAMIQQQQISTTVQVQVQPLTPTSQQPQNQNIPQSPSTPQGHHRTSSAPPQAFTSQGNIVSQQAQYHQTQQQQTPIYSTQMSQGSYGSHQNMSQYNQPIYVSSSSSQSLNQQLHNAPVQNQNGPIYVSSNVAPPTPPTAIASTAGGPPQPPVVPIYGQTHNANVNNGYGSHQQYAQAPVPAQTPAGGPPTAPPPPPFNTGYMNGSSQPPAAPPAPMAGPGPAVVPNFNGGGAPPPPPPPPMGGLNANGSMDMSSLAAQLQQKKNTLKGNAKTNPPPPPPAENSGSSTSSGGSGNYGTIGRTSTGMASMMDEMAKTLARRRAQAEKKPEVENGNDGRGYEKSNTLPHKLGNSNSNNAGGNNCNTLGGSSGSESPRPSRKRFGSASEETILKQVNGGDLSIATPNDFDNLKAEIIREIRNEISKAKQEIIEAIKTEFIRR